MFTRIKELKKTESDGSNHEVKFLGKDYAVYTMTPQDYMIACAIGFLIGAIGSWAFFSSFVLALIVGVICAFFAPRMYRDHKIESNLKMLRLQFKDLLDSLGSSYSAGKNTVGAFHEAENDMISIYGEHSDIVQEVRTINGGLYNNINIEALLSDFASRSGIDDIQSFADVFEVSNRQGGNLREIVLDTRDIISEKIEIEMELDTLLAGNKNELNIMMAMPFVIIIMLNGLGAGTANENTLGNIILKIGCIGLFIFAYIIGKKIINIKI